MFLSDKQIKNLRNLEKPVKLFDGHGLFLLASPNGSRWWRFKYRFGGKEKLLSFGTYPEISLKLARERREDARRMVAVGIDPSVQRHEAKAVVEDTFEAIAREWLESQEKYLAPITLNKTKAFFQTYIFPRLGSRAINQIKPVELLAALRLIEARGIHETAHRTKQSCGRVFRYAVATGRADRDITSDLRGALAPIPSQHHPAIVEPKRIAELLRAIDGYSGQPVTHIALKLAPLVFVRPGELRMAEWSEVNLETAEWRIAAERMKMKERHIVPLSRQAIELFREIHPLTGDGRYVFPSIRSYARPMSENTVNAALRRLGYSKEEMTGHGFRSLASTSLNEQGWPPDVIELQLAHAERNKVRAAYNRAERLVERRQMMQAWADYLDKIRG